MSELPIDQDVMRELIEKLERGESVLIIDDRGLRKIRRVTQLPIRWLNEYKRTSD
ncbi:hypothetical protein ES703_73891 [subsurface metagenome]